MDKKYFEFRSEKRFISCKDASTVDLLVKEAKEAVSNVKAMQVNVEKENIEAVIAAAKEQSSQCDLDKYRN